MLIVFVPFGHQYFPGGGAGAEQARSARVNRCCHGGRLFRQRARTGMYTPLTVLKNGICVRSVTAFIHPVVADHTALLGACTLVA